MFQAIQLTSSIVETSDASFLVDEIFPNQPLVISFGFVDWEKTPDFDFYGRVKKLELETSKPINRILIRDKSNMWYHRGIPGLGLHVDEVTENLREIIQVIAPSRIIAVGQSMGAYAAIMFGALLQVDQILAFGPLSFLESQQALLYHDRRWLSVMMDLEQNLPSSHYFDLPELLEKTGQASKVDIFFGTKPDQGANESVNLDVLHAFRFKPLPNCEIHPVPPSGHAVVKYLIDTKQMDSILGQFILGVPAVHLVNYENQEILSSDWLNWIKENLNLGISSNDLITILMEHGFTEHQGHWALYRAQRD
jgi:predicted esterase